jgi:DNA-binding transcriptional LysR family regulator
VLIDDPALVARRILTAEMRLFASPAYLARRGAPAAPENLADHECVLFRPVDGRSEWSLGGPDGEERIVTVTGCIGANDFSMVRAAAVAGAGIAMLPTFAGTRQPDEPSLVRVLRGWSKPSAGLHFVYPAARHVPKKVVAFRDFVLESFGQPLPRLGRIAAGPGQAS